MKNNNSIYFFCMIFQRHRLVNQILKDDFSQIHAIAIEAYTPEQWSQMDSKSDLHSPKCKGGSKL